MLRNALVLRAGSVLGRARRGASGAGRRAGRAACIALALFALAPGEAPAATVKGRAEGKLLNPAWQDALDPKKRRFTFREPSPTVRPDVWTLTSYLPRELAIVALGEGGENAASPKKVTLSGGRTSLVTIVMRPGEQLVIENADPFKHKLYETSGKAKFNEREIAPKGTTSWTPSEPGTFEIRDRTTPSLRTFVVVEPKAVSVAYPNQKGEFSIELPPGAYKLRGYHSGEPVGAEMPVDVKPTTAPQPLKDPLKVGETPAPAKTGSDKAP